MREDALLTGPLEATNEPYAIAKITGIKLCESFNRQYGASHGVDFRSVMPTNLYGPGDNYHPENSHVIPALIRRFHEARLRATSAVTVWGTGSPRREFLHADDLAQACLFVMELDRATYARHTQPMLSHINVGSGSDLSIAELAAVIARVVGYQGRIEFDTSKPDGTPRKWLDSSRLTKLGWRPGIDFEQGLRGAYQDFLAREGK
jgi:GDP-L-fucose synthase